MHAVSLNGFETLDRLNGVTGSDLAKLNFFSTSTPVVDAALGGLFSSSSSTSIDVHSSGLALVRARLGPTLTVPCRASPRESLVLLIYSFLSLCYCIDNPGMGPRAHFRVGLA